MLVHIKNCQKVKSTTKSSWLLFKPCVKYVKNWDKSQDHMFPNAKHKNKMLFMGLKKCVFLHFIWEFSGSTPVVKVWQKIEF